MHFDVDNIDQVRKELRKEYNRKSYYKNREPVNHITPTEEKNETKF